MLRSPTRRPAADRPFASTPLRGRPGPGVVALLLAVAAGLLVLGTAPAAAQEPPPGEEVELSERALSGLRFRSVGPAVTGGRIHDVEALPDDPATLYAATASGGLWKTTDQGTTWTPLFDEQPVSAFGDVAVAPSDPSVVWAGTGEQQNRQSSTWGNGVYRSTDGGETWTHLGLAATRHVGEVVVHPRDPDVAWVAALGNLWRGSDDRGVYRTTDGGRSWTKVLAGENRFTGAVDLALDPSDPDVIYAAMYQRLRRTWGFNGGGPGSGVYRSEDGGETWTELTAGLPSGEVGRIGLAVAPSRPEVLYALVEHAEEAGTYRSEDGGDTWRKVNDLDPRPMYYSHVEVDPRDPDRVYVLATEFYMSEDGGETFRQMPTRPTYDVGVHSDHHAMWIDPGDTEHFYLAGDAGLHETFDRGETYRRINNLPIGQFYAIGLDRRRPYRIYGGMQDNHSWMGPSATRRWTGIVNDDWKQIGFGDGMYQQPDPTSHRYVYVGAQNGTLFRADAETGDRLDVEPRPPTPLVPGAAERGADRSRGRADEAYRFDWVTPSLVSRHDPTTVYFGGHRLFISRDRGESWRATEDLTKGIDRDTLALMGVVGSEPMLSKHDGTASFSEITTISESPLDPDVLWVGTDDGNVQVSRDGGRSWTEVSRHVPGLESTVYVSRVTASGIGPGVAYAAFDAHRRGDFGSYLYRTTDFGESWTRIDGDLPEEAGPVNDVVEHPGTPRLLFAGTEHGLFASVDAGRSWTALAPVGGGRTNLPTTLYDDLAIHPREDDLVVGTHGRSLWILDDLAPLRGWTEEVAASALHLFPPRPATLFHYWKSTSYRGQAAYAGENPPFGALLTYHLSEAADDARIVVRDAAGEAVRTIEVPGEAGVLHRVTWDLRHEPPPTGRPGPEPPAPEGERVGEVVESDAILPHPAHPLEPAGPFVSPGTYKVTLVAGGRRSTRRLEVRGDPEMPLTDAGWHEREAFLTDLLSLQREAYRATDRARTLLASLRARRDSLEVEDAEAPPGLTARVDSLEALAERLGRTTGRLNRLAGAFNRSGVTQGTVYPPTAAHRARAARLERALESAIEELEGLSGGREDGPPR